MLAKWSSQHNGKLPDPYAKITLDAKRDQHDEDDVKLIKKKKTANKQKKQKQEAKHQKLQQSSAAAAAAAAAVAAQVDTNGNKVRKDEWGMHFFPSSLLQDETTETAALLLPLLTNQLWNERGGGENARIPFFCLVLRLRATATAARLDSFLSPSLSFLSRS